MVQTHLMPPFFNQNALLQATQALLKTFPNVPLPRQLFVPHFHTFADTTSREMGKQLETNAKTPNGGAASISISILMTTDGRKPACDKTFSC